VRTLNSSPSVTEEKARFIINLEADGSLYFKGLRWPLANVDSAAQDTALDNLRRGLRELVKDLKPAVEPAPADDAAPADDLPAEAEAEAAEAEADPTPQEVVT